MVSLGSSSKLLIFGGLGVFAAGWGGGVLLGLLGPPSGETKRRAPQVIDADEHAPPPESPGEERKSSLLEKVFGLDDLEEEREAPAPRPKPTPRPSELREPDDSKSGAAELAQTPEKPTGETGDVVAPEESGKAPAADAPADAPSWKTADGLELPEDAPKPATQEAPKKDPLGENPYK